MTLVIDGDRRKEYGGQFLCFLVVRSRTGLYLIERKEELAIKAVTESL